MSKYKLVQGKKTNHFYICDPDGLWTTSHSYKTVIFCSLDCAKNPPMLVKKTPGCILRWLPARDTPQVQRAAPMGKDAAQTDSSLTTWFGELLLPYCIITLISLGSNWAQVRSEQDLWCWNEKLSDPPSSPCCDLQHVCHQDPGKRLISKGLQIYFKNSKNTKSPALSHRKPGLTLTFVFLEKMETCYRSD